MTLNLTIVGSAGVWQCSDHRLVDPRSGKVVDDYSVKHVILRCRDGSALLAYAGAGRIGTVVLSDWIREMLRGESRTVDQSLILLRENATHDLARLLLAYGMRHMFSVGAILGGRPWMVQIRNFEYKSGMPWGPVLDHFYTVAKEIDGPGRGAIFGNPNAVTARDAELLQSVAARRPRQPKEFRNLLAAINRRAAATPIGKKTVSPHCVTTYMPPAGEPFESGFHDVTGAPRPLVVPMLLFGIDLTEMERNIMETQTKMKQDKTRLGKDTKGQPKEAVTPKNRLRS